MASQTFSVSLPYNSPPLTPDQIISTLSLQPHPEGGHYRQTYLDPTTIASRSTSTMIYFLLRAGEFSHIHRLDAAEGWHFYAGSAIDIVELGKEVKVTRLGIDLAKGERPQHVVPKGVWFGSLPVGQWALVGCTVAPGFLFEKFEMGERGELVKQFPGCKGWIERLTKG